MHTPTPWHTRGSFDGSGDIGIVAGNELIAEAYQAVSRTNGNAPVQANAAFIVTACNAHDALVAALQAALPYLKSYAIYTYGGKDYEAALSKVHYALALATPQEAVR